MGKELTDADRQLAADMLARARVAMSEIEDWSQESLDRLSQAIAWYAGNEETFTASGRIDIVTSSGRFRVK
ncbi:MAG: hypothetical protein VX181_05230 [Pseudomonadota bacterium]|nr:hypothetical protein [Pseudomonadota bacterium]